MENMNDIPLIYAVDDEESIRSLYEAAVPVGGYRVKTFRSGSEMKAQLEQELPDLILLDLMLQGEDGLEDLQALKADRRYAQIPVIIVSAKGEEMDKVNGLNKGADDYLAKPFGVMELIARIKANLRKNAFYHATPIVEYADVRVDADKRAAFVGGKPLNLTKKEFELLAYLTTNATKAKSKDEILKDLWQMEDGIETRTLDMHVSNLRKKMGNSEAKIVTIRGVGYSLR